MAAQLSASSSCSSAVQCGPAGSSYKSMRSAGRQLLHTHCDNFPNTSKSFVLPPSSRNKYTEPTHQPRSNLSRREEAKLQGDCINQEGEKHEKVVTDLFIKMMQQTDDLLPTLVLNSVSVDDDNPVYAKVSTLSSEIHGLRFKNTKDVKGESDFVVFIKNCGIVLLEVKGSVKVNNINSAEKQLQRMNSFIQALYKALTSNSNRIFPIIQVIAIPDELGESPTELTPKGSQFMYKDLCDEFLKSWRSIIKKLNEFFTANPFTSEEFETLTEVLAGVWGSKVVRIPTDTRKNEYKISYDDSNASIGQKIRKTDTMVDTAAISINSEPLTSIFATQPTEIFQYSNELKLLYLSPLQRELFNLHQQCVLRGAAGTGKTLMLIFKVLELKQTSDFRDILILAPHPHTLRIRNILLKNNHTVEMLKTFPPPPPDHNTRLNNTSNIYIMNLDDFFLVDTETLMSYDLTRYHLFLDDFQSLKFFDKDITTSFYDVGDVIDKWYESFRIDERYLWVLMDVVQGRLRNEDKYDGKLSHYFFLTPQHDPRTFNIPIVHLNHTLRNTTDIATLNNEMRDLYINLRTANVSAHVLPAPSMGHNISGQVPTYHRLQKHTDNQHIIPFIIERVREELLLVTKPPYSLPLSHIAILWGDAEDSDTQEKQIAAVRSFLHSEFNTTPVTIQQQLNTNNTHDIIMDNWFNVASFESPCVISFPTRHDACHHYLSMTRARTHLTIIDIGYNGYLISQFLKHAHIVHWKRDNNTYIRYSPHAQENLLEMLTSGLDSFRQSESMQYEVFGIPMGSVLEASMASMVNHVSRTMIEDDLD